MLFSTICYLYKFVFRDNATFSGLFDHGGEGFLCSLLLSQRFAQILLNKFRFALISNGKRHIFEPFIFRLEIFIALAELLRQVQARRTVSVVGGSLLSRSLVLL